MVTHSVLTLVSCFTLEDSSTLCSGGLIHFEGYALHNLNLSLKKIYMYVHSFSRNEFMGFTDGGHVGHSSVLNTLWSK